MGVWGIWMSGGSPRLACLRKYQQGSCVYNYVGKGTGCVWSDVCAVLFLSLQIKELFQFDRCPGGGSGEMG